MKRMRFYRRCEVFGVAPDVRALEARVKKETTLVKQKQLKKAAVDKMVEEVLRCNEFDVVEYTNEDATEATFDEQKQLDQDAFHKILADVIHRNGFKIKERYSRVYDVEEASPSEEPTQQTKKT